MPVTPTPATRVAILVGDMSSRPVLHFYQVSSKYFEGYLSYRADTTSKNQTQGREITPKVRKSELFFSIVTYRPVLFYISTK